MPTRRTQIIDALVADLEANSDVAAGNVHKRFKYLDERFQEVCSLLAFCAPGMDQHEVVMESLHQRLHPGMQ